MRKPWIFTGNTFNRATATSHSKMLVISKDTDGKLFAKNSDPLISPIYTDYHPVYEAYRAISVQYDIATGTRKGQTLDIVTLLKTDLKEQLPLWQNKIQGVYPVGTPQEMAYFPQNRIPFLSGKYDERIQAVEVLADKLAADPSPILTAYAPTVQSFFMLLDTARNTQVQDKGLVAILVRSREAQRKLVAKALYTVLARLMFVYHNDTDQVSSYFDLALIRTKAKGDSIAADELEIHGKVTIEGGTIPVVNAKVMLNDVDKSNVKIKATAGFAETFTDEDGRYKFFFEGLPPNETGFINMTIDCPGFQPYEQIIEVTTGTIVTVDVALALGMRKAA